MLKIYTLSYFQVVCSLLYIKYGNSAWFDSNIKKSKNYKGSSLAVKICFKKLRLFPVLSVSIEGSCAKTVAAG